MISPQLVARHAAASPASPSPRGSLSASSSSTPMSPGEAGARRVSMTHRPSLSMGSNGVMMPSKKVASTSEMASAIKTQTPEAVAEALLNSEGDYVEGLKDALDQFCLRLRNHIVLKRELLSELEIVKLFNHIASIKNFNSTLYHDLVALYDQGPEILLQNLGSTMGKFTPVRT